MKYRKLGNTGLIVSEVALGTMQFGGKMNMGNLGQEETTRMVKQALDRGINFIDTADVYSLGRERDLLGQRLERHPGRDRAGHQSPASHGREFQPTAAPPA